MEQLSQNTLYRNRIPKEKGVYSNRNLENYLNHRNKYITDNQYKLQVDNEKCEIIKNFNTILTNGNYLWNAQGGIDNCLECVTDATLQLWLPDKYKLQANFEDNEIELRDCFKEAVNNPLSVYIECKDNGSLNVNTYHIKKSHFQNNHTQSLLSQQNTDSENRNLKGFAAPFNTEFDLVKFAIENNIRRSTHDDMISGWCTLRFVHNTERIYHIIIFQIIKFHLIIWAPQLAQIQCPRIVFSSLEELSQYRHESVYGNRNNNRNQIKNINFIHYTTHIYLFPFARKLTILEYSFRRLSSEIWPYSNSRYIADVLMQWHTETHPNQSFEKYIRYDVQKHSYNYFLFVSNMNQKFTHPLTLALYDNLKIYLQNELFAMETYPLLFQFYNKCSTMVDITLSYLQTNLNIETFFGCIQMSFRQNTSYSSDKHVYRNFHKDNVICSYAQNVTHDLTLEFRTECMDMWSELQQYNINNVNRFETVRNILTTNTKYLEVGVMRGIQHIVLDGSDLSVLTKQLCMEWSNLSGYDIRFHSVNENKCNGFYANKQSNIFQGPIPARYILRKQLIPTVITTQQYIQYSKSFFFGNPSHLNDILTAGGLIKGLVISVDDSNADDNDSKERELEHRQASRFVDSQDSDNVSLDFNGNLYTNAPLTHLPYSASIAMINHQSNTNASNINQSDSINRNRHSNSRSYERPLHHVVYNLRNAHKQKKIETGSLLLQNMIDPSPYKLAKQCLTDSLTIIDKTLSTSRVYINSINVLIKNINRVIQHHHYKINLFPSILTAVIEPNTFNIFDTHHKSVVRSMDVNIIYEHFSASIQYILLVSIGQRHVEDRITNNTPLGGYVQNNTLLYHKLNNIMNFGQYIRKYNSLFWLRIYSKAYSRQVKPIYELLTTDGFRLMMDTNHNDLNDWNEHSKRLFLQLL
eukprot:468025_1